MRFYLKILLTHSIVISNIFTMTAQQPVKLEVGQAVPDLVFNQVLNYKNKTVKLSDFDDKLVILDFWSVYCTVCIDSWPKLDKIQKEVGDKIIILTVGFDLAEEGQTVKFIENRKKRSLYPLSLPCAIESGSKSILRKLFPSRGFPHLVWIKNGKLVGTSNSHALTIDNIKRANNGEKLNFIERKLRRPVSMDEPLFFSDQKNKWGSIVTGYIDSLKNDIPFGNQVDSSNAYNFIHINQPVPDMYVYAYSRFYPNLLGFGGKLTIHNSNKRSRFKAFEDTKQMDYRQIEAFTDESLFCYQMRLPKTYTLDTIYKFMIHDLDRYFNIKSSIETRKMGCYALIRTSTQDKLQSRSEVIGTLFSNQIDDKHFEILKIRNVPISYLTEQFNAKMRSIILDETGYTDNIDLDIKLQTYDIDKINGQLSKYDLKLVRVSRELKVLVLDYNDDIITN